MPTEEEIKKDPSLGWKKDTSIKPWQHERVMELLLTMVALTEPIGALTRDLKVQDVHRTIVVDPERGTSISGPSIQRVEGLNRTLKDQKDSLLVYERLEERKARYAANSAIKTRAQRHNKVRALALLPPL